MSSYIQVKMVDPFGIMLLKINNYIPGVSEAQPTCLLQTGRMVFSILSSLSSTNTAADIKKLKSFFLPIPSITYPEINLNCVLICSTM